MRFFRYHYAVFFIHNDDGKWGFGRMEITSDKPINSSSEIKEIENIVIEEHRHKQVVVNNLMLLERSNLALGILWLIVKEIAEGIRLSFTRSADDALNEYIEANRK